MYPRAPGGHYNQKPMAGGRYPMPGGFNTTSGYGPSQRFGFTTPTNYIKPETLEMFNAINQDQSGQIKFDELKITLVDDNDKTFSEASCRFLFNMFDQDGNGTLDIGEFQGFFEFMNHCEVTFAKYDRDKSHTIDKNEFATAVKQEIGFAFSPEFIERLFDKVDFDNRKHIDADQFVVLFVQLQRLTDDFASHDPQRAGVITIDYNDFMYTALKSLF